MNFALIEVMMHNCVIKYREYICEWKFVLLYTKIQKSVFKYVKFLFLEKMNNFDYWRFLIGNFLLI